MKIQISLIGALLLVLDICILAQTPPSQNNSVTVSKSNSPITLDVIDSQAGAEVFGLKRRLANMRDKALQQILRDRVIELEAEANGKTPAEWIEAFAKNSPLPYGLGATKRIF